MLRSAGATISLGVLLAAVLGACGRFAFDDQTRADAGDGGDSADAPVACAAFGAFGPPVPLVAVNTVAGEIDPSFSPDGLTLYFTTNAQPTLDIFQTTRATLTSPWGPPSAVPGLATADTEGNPAISSDDLSMYFGISEIRESKRLTPGGPFGTSVQVLAAVAGLQNPMGADLSADDLTMYFSADSTATGIRALFQMTRPDRASGFGTPAEMTSVHGLGNDGFPSISRDGLELYFHNGGAELNLYVSRRTGTDVPFPTGQVIPLINDPLRNDSDPDLSPDGSTLVFASERAGGLGDFDLYVTTRPCL